MVEVETAGELAAHVGTPLGRSRAVRIEQEMIDRFAALTGDDHWIHVDPDRAARDMSGRTTIAHGLLVLSLAPKLKDDLYRIRARGIGLNYGYDRVRFVRPVQLGQSIQLEVTILEVSDHLRGTKIAMRHDMLFGATGEVAVSAENIVLIEEARR